MMKLPANFPEGAMDEKLHATAKTCGRPPVSGREDRRPALHSLEKPTSDRAGHPGRAAAAGCLAVLLAALLTGCADLSAIREFAGISARSAEYTTLVSQYAEFPEREKRFLPAAFHADLDRQSQRRAEQKKCLLLRHTVIEEYMTALGRLAADDVVVYDREVDALGKAVAENALAGEADASAFTSISKLIFRAAADDWRQRQLTELITEANAPFQAVVGALKQIVDKGFAGDLDTEEAAMQKHYRTLILSSQDPAGIAALEEWRDFRLADLKARRSAVQGYSRVLASIAAGHQELFDHREDLFNQKFLRQISGSAQALHKLYNALSQT
jgi:hypothetical protein